MLPQLETLINFFRRFPGIGNRSAERLALTLVDKFTKEDIKLFAQAVLSVNDLQHCRKCHMLSVDDICENCLTCAHSDKIMVVENSLDVLQIAQAYDFQGLYHVTNGLINFARGIDPQMLNLQDILLRLENINEVIIATNATVEGDITANYLKEIILQKYPNIIITRIGYGLPVGLDFKYADSETIKCALTNRIKMK